MKKGLVLSLALVPFVAGCAHHNVMFNTSNGNPIKEDKPDYTSKADFLIWGWFQSEKVNAQQICGNKKVKAVSTRAKSIDRFLELLTVGFYSPRTVSVWCEK